MRIKQALNLAKESLKDHKNEAVFILCEYLKKDKIWLYLNEELEFDEKPYFDLISRFKKGEPFEYIFKKAYFYNLEFYVENGVLIPRYDSEILLVKLIDLCKKNNFKNILEIGFGSGILSIILAKELSLKITACDISAKALEIAKKNAKIHKVDHLIDFILCDFRDLKYNKFDLIFSNPPYIKNDYKLDKWVLNEPKEALFGGEKGYEILEEIIKFSFSNNVKYLACEFGYDQKEILQEILNKNFYQSQFFKDERGFNRAFWAILKGEINESN
ncbi:HemK/PrmC family methyltransferase [Campylobacter sp. TTU_617]|uniref:HemK/PrmC family methyltransferase n=2 Tax=unclassified Campylobacter TaxID=2593542 RepID=UPI0019057347|nr:HemK/PrmC family methyltransferase [Campylobacter sp. TTU_617]MBK1971831.1 peptide chain release factor N(5)-glutamine methyltransferase [Campylobacter sp. TTU_617]